MSKACYCTTMDNPWNPFTNYKEWNAYDTEFKYHTNEWLAIFAKTSSNLEEDEENDAIEDAVNMFLELNPYGVHYKLYESDADTVIPLANEAFRSVNSHSVSQNPTQ